MIIVWYFVLFVILFYHVDSCSLTFELMFCQVLYNILDWPTRPNSNLVVIGTYTFVCFTCDFRWPFNYSLTVTERRYSEHNGSS